MLLAAGVFRPSNAALTAPPLHTGSVLVQPLSGTTQSARGATTDSLSKVDARDAGSRLARAAEAAQGMLWDVECLQPGDQLRLVIGWHAVG